MEKIEKFLLPENYNGVYKYEASSSLNLTKEVAAKINELVDFVNSFAEDDLKYKQTVDGTVRKAILYMKDNLVNTLNELLKIKGDSMVEKYVENYIGYLRNQLENLLGSIKEGSTVLDAEIIDLRVGADGNLYNTAGESIRFNIQIIFDYIEQLNNLMLSNLIINEVESLNVQWEKAKIIDSLGKIVNVVNGDQAFLLSNKINVKPLEKYVITGSALKDQYIYSFYNENGVIINGCKANNLNQDKVNSNYGVVEDKIIVVPIGSVSLRVSGNTGVLTPTIHKVIKESEKNETLTNWINNISEILKNNAFEYDTPLTFNYINKCVIEKDGKPLISDLLSDNYLVSDPIEVNAGEIYNVIGSTHYAKCTYALYDANDNPVIFDLVEDKSGFTLLNKDVLIPQNVKYLRVACSTSSQYFEVKKAIGIKSSDANTLKNKKWVAFGDSLTESNYRAKKNYTHYINEETGINVLNYGKSGSGYVRSENLWKERVMELKNIEFDVITLFGSGNDLNTEVITIPLGSATDTGTSSIAGYINDTIENLLIVKPFVKVGLITPTPWVNQTPKENNCRMEQYSNLIIEIGKRWGIPVLDLYHKSGLQPDNENYRKEFYNEDGIQDEGVHPNSKGHKLIYPMIREFLKTLI